MTNIHKVLIMKVPFGRYFTSKHLNGLLSSGIRAEEILQRHLPKREFKRKKREILDLVAPKQCVVYSKALLDEPELDDMLAESIGYIHRFSKLDVCRPNIIHLVRDYKRKPVIEANIYGYHQIVKAFFSRHLSVDLRFKAYEIFNDAINIDKRNGTNTFSATLQLCWLHFSDIKQYRKLIDILYVDPKLYPDQYYAWLWQCVASNESGGNFEDTPYYNDDRFIRIVNKLYYKNKAMLFREMINRFGEHLPRFRKAG